MSGLSMSVRARMGVERGVQLRACLVGVQRRLVSCSSHSFRACIDVLPSLSWIYVVE